MTEFNFADLVRARRETFGAIPAAARVSFKAESRQQSGLQSRVRIRNFEFLVDEPPALGGTDTAPNPVEFALAALATCQEITYRLHADHLGIPVTNVAVTVEGDIDLRGFFGVDDAVRPGFLEVRGTVAIESPAPYEDIVRLKEHVDEHCPVFDLLSRATPLRLDLVAPIREAVAIDA